MIGDMKRLSPTAAQLPRTVSGYVDAGKRAKELFELGVNVMCVNTDKAGWGGSMDDLSSVTAVHKKWQGKALNVPETSA